MIHVPANIFERCRIGDPFPKHLARWRRLLVTMWLIHGGSDDVPSFVAQATAARAVWDVDVNGLKREARVSVVSALSQLKELGFVQSFDAVEGGFAVELVKEGA